MKLSAESQVTNYYTHRKRTRHIKSPNLQSSIGFQFLELRKKKKSILIRRRAATREMRGVFELGRETRRSKIDEVVGVAE